MHLKGVNFANNRGQLTVFIIVAIVIVAAVVIFFVVRNSQQATNLPQEIQPVYNTFLTCLEQDLSTGIDVIESQGGYIELPDFEPGSSYMPFSSQLDFLGNPIPYWYYVSGNNVQKEQVPTLDSMQKQLSSFVQGKIKGCRFDDYYDEGFEINAGEPKADVTINDKDVEINLNLDLGITKGNDSASVSNHKVSVSSNLGALYKSAVEVYNTEQKTLFLEKYGIDTLRLYAPVDGVEIQCSPLTWNTEKILGDVQTGVQENTLTLRKGSKSFADEKNKYFLQDLNIEGDLRFLNSKNWPYTFEVTPARGNLLVSNPVGNQPGLGILGFCYVPYHFVYDLKYPVLAQISIDNEIFQFPMAVIIQGNNARNALNTTAVERQTPNICNQKNTEIQVNTYDTNLNPVDAEISYECFGNPCDIGNTTSGSINEQFPQCANGFILARADGFKDVRYQFSTVNPGSTDVILDRVYEKEVRLKLDGVDYTKNAMVSFIASDGTETIVYPEQTKVKLSEGQYEVQVYVYRNSSLNIGATKSQQCVDVPSSGIGGFLGFTKEKCFTVEFPAQVVSNALSGGGKQNYFILESQLANSNVIQINAQSLPVPSTIQQLQDNYNLFDEKGLTISFV